MTVKNELKSKTTATVAPVKKRNSPKTLKEYIQAQMPAIEKALPSVITAERFTRMALTAVSSNPKLAECTPTSFLGALMQAAQLGLEPNTPLGQAYLIPYKNNKKNVMECQYQTGYKGLIDLAYRSGEFKSIYARAVYANDEFSFQYGLEQNLVHKPTMAKDKGEIIAYYGVFTLVNGGFGLEVMSMAEVQAHAKKFSKAYSSGYGSPWASDFDAMARKTLIKKVLKYAPIKTEFVKGVAADETVKTNISSDMTNEPNETNVIEDANYSVVDGEEIDLNTGEVFEDAKDVASPL